MICFGPLNPATKTSFCLKIYKKSKFSAFLIQNDLYFKKDLLLMLYHLKTRKINSFDKFQMVWYYPKIINYHFFVCLIIAHIVT